MGRGSATGSARRLRPTVRSVALGSGWPRLDITSNPESADARMYRRHRESTDAGQSRQARSKGDCFREATPLLLAYLRVQRVAGAQARRRVVRSEYGKYERDVGNQAGWLNCGNSSWHGQQMDWSKCRDQQCWYPWGHVLENQRWPETTWIELNDCDSHQWKLIPVRAAS